LTFCYFDLKVEVVLRGRHLQWDTSVADARFLVQYAVGHVVSCQTNLLLGRLIVYMIVQIFHFQGTLFNIAPQMVIPIMTLERRNHLLAFQNQC